MTDIRKPRRGSLAFRPRKRAESQNPSFNAWPDVKEKSILGFAGYKAGMITANWIEQLEGKKGSIRAVGGATVIETPPMQVYGVRYINNGICKDLITDNQEILKLLKAKKLNFSLKDRVEELKNLKDENGNVRLLTFTMPGLTGIGKKHIERMEIAVGGADLKEKVDYALSLLGKELRVKDVLKPGMFVDVSAITKGKGWQGPVKRFGVAKQRRKATGKVRHVGTLGQFHPGYTFYTVPHAGQTGYHKRVEVNKWILAVLSKEKALEITPKSGFPHYGVLRNEAIVIKGSVPGPVKRLVRIRYSMKKQVIKEPQTSL
jgi:large subunit ribosomal protein L3